MSQAESNMKDLICFACQDVTEERCAGCTYPFCADCLDEYACESCKVPMCGNCESLCRECQGEEEEEIAPDTMMCARCHRRVDEDRRCDEDSHNWYAESERVLPYSDILAVAKKIVD